MAIGKNSFHVVGPRSTRVLRQNGLPGQIELAAMQPRPADFKTDSKMKRIGNIGS
jgi:hypothetical protein